MLSPRKAGGGLRRVTSGLDGLGQLGQMRRDLARDAGRSARRVERVAVGLRALPHQTQALADLLLGQIGELNPMRARIGKRRVGRTAAREVGIQLYDVAHIDHDQEGRPAFLGGQGAGVAFGLRAGT